jgi:hypothetical protein
MVTTRLEAGDLQAAASSETLGVIDPPGSMRGAHLVTVDHPPIAGVTPSNDIKAVDMNGDGAPDILFVPYQCDDAGAWSATQTGTTCFDTFVQVGRQLQRVHQDRVRNC